MASFCLISWGFSFISLPCHFPASELAVAYWTVHLFGLFILVISAICEILGNYNLNVTVIAFKGELEANLIHLIRGAESFPLSFLPSALSRPVHRRRC